MMDSIARRLKLEPEEARHALALALMLFGLTGSYTLVRTVRDSAFLAVLPASLLPRVYVAAGILTLAGSLAFARLTRRRPAWESLGVASMAVAVSLALFAWLLRLRVTWVPIAFYLWVSAYGLILMSQFWAFASTLSHPREARRTFWLIGVGGLLGGLAAGLLAAPLARHWSSLLLPAAGLAAFVTFRAYRAARFANLELDQPGPSLPDEPLRISRHPYLRWLALATLCSVMVTTLVDFQFKSELQRRFPSSADMAFVLGLFYVGLNLCALAVQVFGTRRLLERLGAADSAALLPAGLGVGALVAIAVPGFLVVTASRLWDQLMQLSLHRVARELFYFPLPHDLRRRAKALIEASVERIGDGFAGALLLLMGATLGLGTRPLAGVVAGLVGLWGIAWLGVRRGYLSELGRNLRRLNLGSERSPLSLCEASVIRETERLLGSPYERVVLQGVDLLEENAPERLDGHVAGLLEHAAPAVRRCALERVRARGAADHMARVTVLTGDLDAGVRGEAMLTLSALRGVDVTQTAEGLLKSEDSGLRASAAVVAIEHALPPVREWGRGMVDRILERGSGEERAAVAEALARRPGADSLHEVLDRLLRDPEVAVQQAALRSAGRLRRREHVPVLLGFLAPRATREAARTGLAGYGDRVVGTLGDYLSDPEVSLELRLQIPSVLADIGSQAAVDTLFRSRRTDELRLAHQILKASNRLRSSEPALRFPEALVVQDLEDDVRGFSRALAQRRACPTSSQAATAEWLLSTALGERMEQAVERVFRRLALLYPPREVHAAYRGVTSSDLRRRGNALEYLDTALASPHRRLVQPATDPLSDEERLQIAAARYGIRVLGFEDALAELMKSDDAWLRACALFVAGERRHTSLRERVEACLGSTDARVRDAAHWAQRALAGGSRP